MKSFFTDIEIFFYALFRNQAYWRVRFQDGGLSKLLNFSEAFDLFTIHNKSTLFIDYSYARRFFN